MVRHLGCLYVLAIINSDAINTGVHVSFEWVFSVFFFFFCIYIHMSEIAGSYGNSIIFLVF